MALTKHSEGSLREFWAIAFPLMIASFSVMFMLFVDRLLLAHYSTEALNSAVTATNLGWAFIFAWMVLGSISEVFVAQHNGADQLKKLGEPVWQMLWLSLASALFFIPMGKWGGSLFFGTGTEFETEREYFRWMMYFGPSFPLYAALIGFFIGQGKTKMITILAVIANVFNATLDTILIFGIQGWIAPGGAIGAAIATSGCTIFQGMVLLMVFLNRKNRLLHGTHHLAFHSKTFWKCIKIGLPGALFALIELLGWASFYGMMAQLGKNYITIAGICQSIALLFYFFQEGVSKAATTLVGNFIGGKKHHNVSKVLKSGVQLLLIFFFITAALFISSPNFLISQFLPDASDEYIDAIYNSLLVCLFYILFYLLFEGIRLLLAGILTAAGDTKFLLIAGSLSIWIFLVLPVYLFVVRLGGRIETAVLFCVFYSLCACMIYYWRFTTDVWKHKRII